jgi:hypothetical protein
MVHEPKPQSESERFDPEDHAAMKRALRDRDREDLRLGRATAAEIHKRNLFLGQLDMSRTKIVDYGPHSGTGEAKSPKKKP